MGFNNKCEKPATIHVTGFSGRVAEIGNSMNAACWRVKKHELASAEAFSAQEVRACSLPDCLLHLQTAGGTVISCDTALAGVLFKALSLLNPALFEQAVVLLPGALHPE